MTEIKIKLDHAEAKAELTGVLTTRMVGVLVTFEFGPVWDGLIKAAVFQGSGASVVEMLFHTNDAFVPPEVLVAAGSTLKIGVEGRSPDGELVIPSTMVEVGEVLEGADPRNTELEEITQPVWAQIMAELEALAGRTEEQMTEHIEDPKAHPAVWTAINERIPKSSIVNYLDCTDDSAVLGGSVGREILRKLAVCVKTVNGVAPDAKGNVNVAAASDDHINALIDAKLGVIENGTY